MLKVSIILPVYNAAPSVQRMLDSLKEQTMPDFEVLMIDDGSTDGSGRILDDYARKDVRFKVVHKPNGGVSSARQTGLDLAQGEYVIHADSDDWVDLTMLEEMLAAIGDNDVLIADFYNNNRTEQVYSRQRPASLDPLAILRELFQQLHGSCWNKLVRRACYSKYNISFPIGINHCEDLFTWVQLFQHPEVKVNYLPKAFYHYCENDSSITRHFTRNTYEVRLKFREKLKGILHVSGAKDIIENVSFNIFTEGVIYNVLSDVEIREGLKQYRVQIKQLKSLRWKLGFLLLSLGFTKLAHKLIHY